MTDEGHGDCYYIAPGGKTGNYRGNWRMTEILYSMRIKMTRKREDAGGGGGEGSGGGPLPVPGSSSLLVL